MKQRGGFMNSTSDVKSAMLALLGLGLTGMVVGLGTGWAFQRGGLDFDVFHAAWKLVLSGQPSEIYRSSPDRFLYAPGFAWLLSPLGLLPRGAALAIWCLSKAAVLASSFAPFPASDVVKDPVIAAGLSAWA